MDSMIVFENIPQSLKVRKQWVLWESSTGTKVPCSITGERAKCNDPSTWSAYDEVCEVYERGGYDGIGYEFSTDDSFAGIDLDGCRDPKTGEIADWAKIVINTIDSYAEISPSQTGVKIFLIGQSPLPNGKNKKLSGMPKVCEKEPALEIYDHGRFFTVTGQLLPGQSDLQNRQKQLEKLCKILFPEPVAIKKPLSLPRQDTSIVERARKYLANVDAAISGQGGSNTTFRAACAMACGFMLDKETTMILMREYSDRCIPPWTEAELLHKVNDALKADGDKGYLLDVPQEEWKNIPIPQCKEKPQSNRRRSTLQEATKKVFQRIRDGEDGLVRTGLPELDDTIGGGLEYGEMVIVAARPSHGKSVVGLQCAHNWTEAGYPVLIISEEMSDIALGRRTIQYASEVPPEYWHNRIDDIEKDVDTFHQSRATCFLVESCGTAAAVEEEVRWHVENHNVRHIIVDYAQLLSSPGKSRYEQVTNTSVTLRRIANEHKAILIAMCQLNRDIESRDKFEPRMADIKETGQLEQDADVIIFLVWPWRNNKQCNVHEYKFYVAKNRNRPIHQQVIVCRFEPSRQMITRQSIQDFPNYEPCFDNIPE